MIRVAKLFIVVISFVSCKQNNNNAELTMLIDGLINSSKHVEHSNIGLYAQYEYYASEPAYASVAIKLFPKSKKIKEYTAVMIREIEIELEKNTLKVKSATPDLFDKLLNYKRNLISMLDPTDQNERPAVYQSAAEAQRKLYAEMPVLAVVDDTTSSSAKQQFDSVFNNSNPLMQKAILYKIKNDVLLSEYAILFYLFSRYCFLPIHYEEYAVVASLNSSYVKSGDNMELTAGMGRFAGDASPRVTVNDKEIELKGYGHTTHFFQAKGKPGKYNLKVKFEYFRADGSKESVTKNLNYTILP